MRIRGIGPAVTLAIAVILAGAPMTTVAEATVAGARVATSRVVTVHAVSLDCISHGVAGCVNVAMDLTWSESAQAGRLCIDVNDYRTPAPVPSYGCTELARGAVRLLRNHALAVAPQRVTTTASDDCYRADPDEGCVPRTLTLVAAATVVPLRIATNEATGGHREGCVAHRKGRTTVYAADVRMQVDGFRYRMPSAAPGGPRNGATLVVIEERSGARC